MMADFEKFADGNCRVNVGQESVHVCKLYGPTIFADLTVTPVMDGDDAYWLVLRDGKEWCRIPAQLDEDFEGEGIE